MDRVVDAQVHVFGQASAARATSKGHAPLDAPRVVAEMDAAGVQRAVVVAAAGQLNNPEALDAAAAYPDRFTVMTTVDVDPPLDRHAILAEFARWSGRSRGVRLSLPPRRATWWHSGAADWFWAAMSDAGVPLMVWAPNQSSELAAVADRWPTLRIIVDHLGMPLDVRAADAAPIIGALTGLASRPNVAVKASALPRLSCRPYPYPDVAPLVHEVLGAFGNQRVFWGSDFTRLPCSYGSAVGMVPESFGFLSDDDREWLMGRALANWLDWEPW